MSEETGITIINLRTYWVDPGARPDDSEMNWVPRQRPPSAWVDWFFRSVYEDLRDLALFVQKFCMGREFTAGDLEVNCADGAYIGAVGVNEIPVVVYAVGVLRQAHLMTRASVPDGVNTRVKVVWFTENETEGKHAVLKVLHKATAAGENRMGSRTTTTVVAGVSATAWTQMETIFDIGDIAQGSMLDLWIAVDGTHQSHTLASSVYVAQVIVDPEDEEE